MMGQSWLRPLAALLVLCLVFSLLAAPLIQPAFAQGGGTITYGASVTGELTAAEPLALYRLTGAAGDAVVIDALRLGGVSALRLTLLSPDQSTLASSGAAALRSGSPDAQIALVLPQDGVYTVLVGTADDSPATFALRAERRAAVSATPLRFGVLEQVVAVESVPRAYSFEAADCAVTLVANARAAVPGALAVWVHDADGQLVALLSGGRAIEQRVTVAPQSGRYTVEVAARGARASGLSLLVACAADVPGSGVTQPAAGLETQAEPDDAERDTPGEAVVRPADCGPFRLASPREGLPNGPVTIYWDAAPNTATYRLTVYNEAAVAVLVREIQPPASSATIDVSNAAIGVGFYFTVEVVALDGLGRVACSDSAQQGREAVEPVPGS